MSNKLHDREAKLGAWMNGDVEDEDLSIADVRLLEERVMAAVAAKMLQTPGVTTFAQHMTIQ